jgi:hypothetical protein
MSNLYTPKDVSSMMNLIDTFIRNKMVEEKGTRSYDHYHPSEIGKCLRKQQYLHYAWKGLIDVKFKPHTSLKQRLFDKGHNMHDRWVRYFDEIGNVLMGRWKCKNKLCHMFNDAGFMDNSLDISEVHKKNLTRIYGQKGAIFRPEKCVCGCYDFEYLETKVIDKDLNIKGNADLVINCENLKEERFNEVRISYNDEFLPKGDSKVVIDMKSIGDGPWKRQVMTKGPHKDYLIQLTSYIHILDCDYGILAYENKNDSEMAWFKVPRNDKWWEIIQYQTRTMIEMAKNRKLPPPKHLTKSDYICKQQCNFRELCHKSKIWDSPDLDKKRKSFYKSLL